MRIFAHLIAVTLVASPGVAQEGVTLATNESGAYGTFLTDGDGLPVYLFTADRSAGGEAEVSCTDVVCVGAWPWVTTRADPQAAGEVQPELLGTLAHDQEVVVTYAGWPLYYHNADEAEAEPRGHDVESFGGRWLLVDPSGEPIAP